MIMVESGALRLWSPYDRMKKQNCARLKYKKIYIQMNTEKKYDYYKIINDDFTKQRPR